ncbi:MAG TPA: GlsB/YeaQ/YmgE family stress response membrane protein [Vicinamibacterales bacterium]|nr:GlsB/YeaQ/YmgE family stress response membrane protein [Vicinamibacterales bacterium]
MLGILGWALFGLIVGALAKLVMPGRDPGGIIVTMLLGIAGAVLGGFVGRAMNLYGPNEPAGFVMSFIGAVFLLWIYRMMVGRKTVARP